MSETTEPGKGASLEGAELESARTRQISAEQFLAEASRALSRTSDLDLALSGILDLAVSQFADWCFLDLLTSTGDAYDRVAVAFRDPTAEKQASQLKRRYTLRTSNRVGVERALSEGRALLACDVDDERLQQLARDEEHLHAARLLRMRSSVVAPLLIRGRPIGAISLISSFQNYGGTELWLAEQLAHAAAGAIEKAQWRQGERRIEAHVADLQRITEALFAAPTAEAVAELVCHLGRPAIDAACAAAWLLRNDELSLLAAEGIADVQQLAALNCGAAALVNEAARLGKAVWDFAPPLSMDAGESSNQARFYGVLPVTHGPRVRGVLLFGASGEKAFDSAERLFLMSLAQQCAQALERVRLLDRERILQELESRSTSRLELLARAGEVLNGSLDRPQILGAIAKLVVPSIADWCFIDLLEGDTIRRVVVEISAPSSTVDESRRPIAREGRIGDGSLVAGVVEDGRPQLHPLLSDEVLEAVLYGEPEQTSIRARKPISFVSAPLKANERTIGALSLGTTAESGRTYDASDFAFAQELARRAGAAVAIANVHTHLAQAHEHVTRVFAQVPFAIAMYRGPEHRFAFVNPPYLEGTAKTKAILGQRHADVFPEGRRTSIPLLDSVFQSGRPRNIPEIRVSLEREGSKQEAFFDCCLVPSRDENGAIDGLISASFDVTERVIARREAEQAQRETELIGQRLRLALEAAQLGAWDFDLVRGELLWDERCRAIHGLSSHAPIERTAAFELIHPDDRATARAEIASATSGQQDRELVLEYRIIRVSDQSTRWLLTKGRVFFDSERAVRMVGILFDNTEAKALAAERAVLLEREKRARAEAERVNRSKDRFLATVSHELRTPLNAIAGWAHILERAPHDTSAVVRAVEVVQRSTRAQAKLIDEILDVSRISAGKMTIEPCHFDLAKELRGLLESVRPLAQRKEIVLNFHGVEHPFLLWADPERLRQVASNLIDNSLKFTPREGRVDLRLERRDDLAILSVEDTGRGIEPQFLPFVFERFLQADGSTTRAAGGLGLGLSIVRNIVELHGGTIAAQSAGLGRGSRFEIKIPVEPPNEEPASTPRPTMQVASSNAARVDFTLNGLCVLVVEDDDDGRELLVGLLSRRGALVASAGSAEEGWALLNASSFDVLVSDIGMPHEDGYSLIRRIRGRTDAAASIRAIALTAYAGDVDKTEALAAGFDAYLTKPIDGAQLAAELARFRVR